MNRRIVRPGVVNRMTEKLNKNNVQVSYEVVDAVLSAFLDTVVESLANGDRIELRGYMTIEPRLHKEKHVKDNVNGGATLVPARYRAKIAAGMKLREACKRLPQKKNEEE